MGIVRLSEADFVNTIYFLRITQSAAPSMNRYLDFAVRKSLAMKEKEAGNPNAAHFLWSAFKILRFILVASPFSFWSATKRL